MVDLLDFFVIANKLKWTDRRGWLYKANIRQPESVADHTYLTALMCMIMAEQRGLNVTKTIKMALLHDIAESITGDYMPEELPEGKKDAQERKAIKTILSKLPAKMRSNYAKLWKEYRSMSSKEAKLVHEIDKLEMALQAYDYKKRGYPSPTLENFFVYAKRGISDKALLKMLNSLKRART